MLLIIIFQVCPTPNLDVECSAYLTTFSSRETFSLLLLVTKLVERIVYLNQGHISSIYTFAFGWNFLASWRNLHHIDFCKLFDRKSLAERHMTEPIHNDLNVEVIFSRMYQ